MENCPATKKVSKGAPKWMATFADMSTLLLTFFVLMLSFANIDIQAFHDLLGSVQNAFGVQTRERGEFQAVLKDNDHGNAWENVKLDSLEQEIGKIESQQMASHIENVVKDNNLKDQTEVQIGQNSVRIRITGQLMFAPGKATLRYKAFKFLNGIVEAMKNYDYYLLVEGHTDSLDISTEIFPSNWELSGARAAAVVRYLIKKGIDHKRLSGIGHAFNYPIASNKTREGRNLNRRVEFIFTRTPFRAVIN